MPSGTLVTDRSPSSTVPWSVDALGLLTDRFLPALLFLTLAAINGWALLGTGLHGGPASDARSSVPTLLAATHGLLVLIFYGLIAALCLVRWAPLGRRAGLPGLAVALAGTFLMSAVTGQPAVVRDWRVIALSDGFLSAGLAVSIYATASLGRCFGLAPEARGLVTSGAYRLMRHPIYLGEIVAALGVVLPVLTPFTAAVFGLFVICQVARAVLEERALTAAFPEYAEYRRRVPALVPLPLRGTRTRCTGRRRRRRSAVR